MKNSTYSRRSQMVSTVKKSQARMPAACWRRNARQVVAVGRGAGVEPVAAQRGADRGCRDPDAEPEQLALDALVAPAWILPRQADDQLLQLLVKWRSPGSAVRVGPGAGDEPPVPAQQRLRPDEKARPAGSGQRTADRGEHRTVDRSEPGSWGLAAQHGQLVTEHQDLQVLASIAAGEQHEQLDGAAQGQVGELRQHAAGLQASQRDATLLRHASCKLPAHEP